MDLSSYVLDRAPDFIRVLASTGLGSAVLGVVGGIVVGAVTTAYLSRRRARMASDEAFRRLEAKKINEHIKLYGSFSNIVGAAIIGAAFIVPYIGNHTMPDEDKLWWVVAGLALPLSGHVFLRFMRSEG